jgi:hypothetical protein
MYLRQQGYLFLNGSGGTYLLSANSNIATSGNGYFTNSFTQSNSLGNNPPGATTITVASARGFSTNDQIGIELDSGQLQWTTITAVNAAANTVNTASALTGSSNGLNNVIYTFSAFAQPPQTIESAVLRDASGNDTDIRWNMTLDEWMSLPSKQSPGFSGDPVAFYYEPHLVGNQGQGYGQLQTDVNQAQDVSKYIVIHYIREVQDFVNPNDEPDFPKEFYEPLYMNLAKRLAPHFNCTWTKAMEDMANQSLSIAARANPRRSILRFNPNNRGALSTQQRYR